MTDLRPAPDPADLPGLDEPAGPAPWARRRLGSVLVDAGILTEEELEDALATQLGAAGPRRRLGQVLVAVGLTTERQIAQALADQLTLRVFDPAVTPCAPECVRQLPRAVSARLAMVVLARDGRHATVAAADPTDVVGLDDVRLHTGASELTVQVATESQVRDALTRAWALSGDSEEVATLFEEESAADDEGAVVADDAPTVRLVSTLLADAVRTGASDVHVEPQRTTLRIRYRVDGVLRDVMALPRSSMAQVTSRIKILSGLDIAERRLPQDGRTRFTVDGRPIDARVSTMPAIHGEKVVVRLLTRSAEIPPLDGLGLSAAQLQAVRSVVDAPQGLLIITGPTGSGKTSTLYSALTEVDATQRNVVTLEDPVEVQFPGITQTQVNERTGLTFGRGLRALLRQDPDVVLVGEVRDVETAELAVRAALTGHLVLTTLHTSSALSAMTRLLDMGVEPFLVASSLSAVVAQRLVRRVCADCSVSDVPDPDLLAALGVTEHDLAGSSPQRGAGCDQCSETGYRGRVGVFEVVPVTPALRRAIAHGTAEHELAAASEAVTTLRQSAVRRALAGETTFDEAARVSHRDH